MTTNKQTSSLHFQSLRRQKGLTLQEVANVAGVSTTEVYVFEIGAVVTRETKQTIIRAFSQLTGQPYTLRDFAYAPEEQPTIAINILSRSQRRDV